MSDIHMVEVGAKPKVERRAVAKGILLLKQETILAIREGKIKKGDVLDVARVAAIMAVKKTPDFVPLCHPIPVSGINVDFEVLDDHIECVCEVSARYRTGVEMEALCGVSAALLTVWDMTKYLEKDENGNYPDTRITEITVVRKTKGKEA